MGKVPKVDLIDPRVEPTDEELLSLAMDVRDDVLARKKVAHERFMGSLIKALRGETNAEMPSRSNRDDLGR